MALLSRFRSRRPEWQHKDAEVRAAAVRRFGPEQQELLLAIARNDADARVRRIAVRKLNDPVILAELAQRDLDVSVREDAGEMLLRLALESTEDTLAAAALEGLSDTKDLAAVARSARSRAARRLALGRLRDSRVIGAVAKTADDPETRLAALEAVQDSLLLADIATKSEHKDVAVAAVARIADRELLEAVAARARNKAAARQARAALGARAALAPPPEPSKDEGAEAVSPAGAQLPTPDDEARAEPDQVAAVRLSLCETVESLSGEEALLRLEAVRSQWEELPLPTGPEGDAFGRRFEEASRSCRERYEKWSAVSVLRKRREELCHELERLAESGDVSQGRLAGSEVKRAWMALPSAGPIDSDLAERFRLSEAALLTREARLREEKARERRENLARLDTLCGKALALAGSETPTLRESQAALREVKTALENPGPLPGPRETQAMLGRLRQARAALFPRIQELLEADEWTRWANLSRQEELCQEAEALVRLEDPEAAERQLRELEARWKEARQAPQGQGEVLWNRFKAARDNVEARLSAHLSTRAEEALANLRRREALCAQAEALADSTDWLKTAQALQKLQGEWKTIGPVPKGKGKVLWERFRRACDQFFGRRKQDLSRRRHEWSANLQRKEALCAEAEAVAQSTDWERAAAEIKRLQTEWKNVGPVRKNRSEAVWQRFRGACSAFFERYRQRDALDRAEGVAQREALISELEGLSSPEAPPDLGERVKTILGHWSQAGSVSNDALGVEERFGRARDRLLETHPEGFRGTELDPEANRVKMDRLCARVEALLLPDSERDASSLVDRLREALASNTIGGRTEVEARWRTAAAEVEVAQQAWNRLSPVRGPVGQALAERFERACRRFAAQRQERARA